MSLLRLALCLIGFALLGGCAAAPQRVDSAPAEQLFAQGDFRGAVEAFRGLARGRTGAARATLLLRAAESLREEGDLLALRAQIGEIAPKWLQGEALARYELLSAELALNADDAESALSLATLDPQLLSAELALRAADLRARALDRLDRPLDAAGERMALLTRVGVDERAVLESELLASLGKLDPDQLNAALAALSANDARRPYIERALRTQGAAALRQVERGSRAVGARDGDAAIWQRDGAPAGLRVALLLPLTGPLAPAGRALRDGFFAAYFDDVGRRPQVQLIDSGASVESALAAYQRAVALGSERVVGPLARDQVGAILRQPALPIPVLALNHPDDAIPPPPGSQQFGLLPDEEAAFVAADMLARGARRAAIIVSSEEWGLRAAQAFRVQFTGGGGVVSAEARMAPNSRDAVATVDAALAAPADAVFLAVQPGQARLLVPQLKFRDGARPIFATSHLYAGIPAPVTDRDLDGVRFCDAPWLFDANPALTPRADLVGALNTVASSPRLVAFGMDAYRLLGYIDWLARHPDDYLPGASGDLSLDAFGRVRRALVCLEFRDGAPRPTDGALSAFGP